METEKTEADDLAEFLIERTPTISKCNNTVILDFADPVEAEQCLHMIGEMIEDAHAAREAKAAIDAGEPTIPWEDLKAEFLPDCSDIPEITELGPRLERDAEGRIIPRRRPVCFATIDELYEAFGAD
jgi:hypothetical protein